MPASLHTHRDRARQRLASLADQVDAQAHTDGDGQVLEETRRLIRLVDTGNVAIPVAHQVLRDVHHAQRRQAAA